MLLSRSSPLRGPKRIACVPISHRTAQAHQLHDRGGINFALAIRVHGCFLDSGPDRRRYRKPKVPWAITVTSNRSTSKSAGVKLKVLGRLGLTVVGVYVAMFAIAWFRFDPHFVEKRQRARINARGILL